MTWKLISIGLHGENEIPILLTHNEVFEYLNRTLVCVNEQTDNIIAFINERDNILKADKLLQSYVNNDNATSSIQIRKWRSYLLKSLLDNINPNCLQGLLELMEFWMTMRKPIDCPHIFPDRNGPFNVKNYFTQSNYDFLLNKNSTWLRQEIANIITAEADLQSLV